MALTLGYQLSGIIALALASHVALIAYVALEWPRLTRLPRTLVTIATAMTFALPWFSGAPLQALLEAFNRAAWFGTFLAALSFLREAAATSPLVRQCGEVVITQPPAKRYATLSGGAFLIGVLLNMAVLNLLGTMVQRANTLTAAAGHRIVQEVRTRRMFSAMIRGFGTAPLGSPLSITLAMILSMVPSVDWRNVLPLGLLTMLLLIAFGWLWDQREAPRHLAGLVGRQAPLPRGWVPITRFFALAVAVFVAAVALEALATIPLPIAILLTAPAAAFVWMISQRRRKGLVRAAALSAARLIRRAPDQFGSMRTEVCVLAAAGLMGTLIAAAIPSEAFAELLVMLGLHGLPVALLVLLLMVILPQFGLNPVLVATIILSSMSRPELFGLSPTLLALATMSGWTLAIGSSPVTTSILIAARMAQVSPRVAGWSWNGRFTVAATFLLLAWISLLGLIL
ncbi:MAG TPA: hypothetical protein PLD59_15740 [Tepidisphaeraceae bacterium]|nr:hypothetical protein [Tepidisphaeraceae bacterium]